MNQTKIDNICDVDAGTLVSSAENLVKKIKNENKVLGTHQVRNVYSQIDQIKMELKGNNDDDNINHQITRLLFLKPKLAYAEARKSAVKPLRQAIEELIDQLDELDNPERRRKGLTNFLHYMEAVVAYHKFHIK